MENFTMDNVTIDTLSALIPTTECWGEYSTIILAILLFISEALPFIRAKSTCNNEAQVIDEVVEQQPSPSMRRDSSIMIEANGLVDILRTLYDKTKKK